MIIANGTLTRQSLAGEVVVVTGGGQGIGYEAARALAWLGATVIIGEIDKQSGKEAAAAIHLERLEKLEDAAESEESMARFSLSLPLKGLANYYGYLYKAAEGYVKDPADRESQLGIVQGWQEEVERLAALLD